MAGKLVKGLVLVGILGVGGGGMFALKKVRGAGGARKVVQHVAGKVKAKAERQERAREGDGGVEVDSDPPESAKPSSMAVGEEGSGSAEPGPAAHGGAAVQMAIKEPAAGAGAEPEPEAELESEAVAEAEVPDPSAETEPKRKFPRKPGTYDRTIKHEKVDRQYILKIPTGYDGSKSMPLMLVFHGGNQNAKQYYDKRSILRQMADSEGFIVAFVQSRTSEPWEDGNWNAVHCCRTAKQNGYDDLGYTRAVVDELKEVLEVDSSRVYAAGFSNGGMMVHKIASKMPGVFAAAAMMSAPIGGIPYKRGPVEVLSTTAGPISVLNIHGKSDKKILYAGGESSQNSYGRRDVGALDGIDFWATQMGCNKNPTTKTIQSGAKERSYSGCSAGVDVKLISIDGLMHAWPQKAEHGFDGDKTVVDFLLAHRKASASGSWRPGSWGPPEIPN